MNVRFPHRVILDLLLEAYAPCKYFGTCAEAHYEPEKGHVPRGYLGATALRTGPQEGVLLRHQRRFLLGTVNRLRAGIGRYSLHRTEHLTGDAIPGRNMKATVPAHVAGGDTRLEMK